MKGNREAPTRQYWALISDDARQKRLGPTLSISSPRQGVTAPNGHTHKVEDRLQGLQGSECQVRRGPPLQPEMYGTECRLRLHVPFFRHQDLTSWPRSLCSRPRRKETSST